MPCGVKLGHHFAGLLSEARDGCAIDWMVPFFRDDTGCAKVVTRLVVLAASHIGPFDIAMCIYCFRHEDAPMKY
jgi:hypothetical protein